MRTTIRVIGCFLIACTIAFALSGCGAGGSGGGSTTPAEVSGIWTGRDEAGGSGTLAVDVTRTGNDLTGTALLTVSGTVYTGSLTGTITNEQVNATVAYDQGYGTVTYTGTITGNTLNGTLTHNTDNGTISLNKQVGEQTSSIAGTFAGTSTQTGGSPKSLSVTFAQTGDTFTGSYISNGATAVPFTGTIIGPNIAYGVAQDPSGAKVTFMGTVSSNGNNMSGNYSVSLGTQTVTGTWAVTKQ
jgi:hypothetical protein